MKKIVLFILLLSISKTFSQKENELSQINIIKNKIAEVQIFNVDSPKNYLFEHIYYDRFGNTSKNILFNKDATVWIKNSYQYNEQQQLISSLNEISNVITKHKYDESGNRFESKSISSDSTVFHQHKMIYDEKNQKIKTFNKKKNSDDFYLSESYFYTNDGLCFKMEQFNESEKLISTEEYEYDKNRNLTFIYRQRVNEKKGTTKYHYNKKGELTKVDYSTGAFRKYKYDKLGNRIEEITYDHDDRILQHREYKYNVFE